MAERTLAIFFEDFTKNAQKRLVAEELGCVTDEAVSHVVVTTDEDLYGYDPNSNNQELQQHVHAKVRYGRHDHRWLMVWDCMDAEFTTVMEENQEGYGTEE